MIAVVFVGNSINASCSIHADTAMRIINLFEFELNQKRLNKNVRANQAKHIENLLGKMWQIVSERGAEQEFSRRLAERFERLLDEIDMEMVVIFESAFDKDQKSSYSGLNLRHRFGWSQPVHERLHDFVAFSRSHVFGLSDNWRKVLIIHNGLCQLGVKWVLGSWLWRPSNGFSLHFDGRRLPGSTVAMFHRVSEDLLEYKGFDENKPTCTLQELSTEKEIFSFE